MNGHDVSEAIQDCDLLIERCAVLMPDLTVAEQQAIAIQGQRIAAIGPASELRRVFSPRGVLDGTDKLAIPGLIDAHTHTAQHLLRGAVIDERPIIWQRILIPFESKLTDEDIYHSARLACLQMARAGITTFGEAGVLEVEGIIRAAGESGMRATISRFTADEHNGLIPTWYADTTSVVIGKTEALFKEYDGSSDGRLHIAFSITGPDNASPALVVAAAAAARQYGTILHIHVGQAETQHCLQQYGLRPVEYLAEYGAVGPNLLAAHAVRLSDREVMMLAERDARVVHCPEGNLLDLGFPKTSAMLALGIKVGLGTDGAKRSDLDLFYQMRLLKAALSAHAGVPVTDAVVLPIQQAFRMPTAGSAAALGLEDAVGSLEVGKKADIVLLRWREPHFFPAQRSFPMVFSVANARDVNDVIIDGRLIVKDRVHQLLDAEAVMAKAGERLSSILARQ
jgi:5-methylthioadenosine/S-adenosylhomocysteine deaminase